MSMQKTDDASASMGKAADPDATAEQLGARLRKGVDTAVDAAADTTQEIMADTSAALAGAGVHLGDKRRELGEAYQRLASTGRDYVRSNPATTVLLAMAAGYSLSWLLRRRH